MNKRDEKERKCFFPFLLFLAEEYTPPPEIVLVLEKFKHATPVPFLVFLQKSTSNRSKGRAEQDDKNDWHY